MIQTLRQKLRTQRGQDLTMAILFILPVVLFLLFLAYPILENFRLSFTDKGLLSLTYSYIGIENFKELVLDSDFWQSFLITFIWMVATVSLQLVLGTAVALVLHRRFFGRGFVRSITLVPYLTPPVIVALLWSWLLNEPYGLINHLLIWIGIINEPIIWLGSFTLTFPVLIFVGVWEYFPFVTITVLARLQTIPPELPEAATVDGATAWQVFRYVTLPQLKSVYFIIIVLRGVWMFNKFDLPYLLTGGGPGRSTLTLPILAYRATFVRFDMGMGAAINIFIFITLAIGALIYFRIYKLEEQI